MKLIDSSFKSLDYNSDYSLENEKKLIEVVGRTCYLSGDKITDSSYQGFIDRLISSNHTAMLEFGTIYLKTSDKDIIEFYKYNPYSRVTGSIDGKIKYITTNYRVLIENHRQSDLVYLSEPNIFFDTRHTIQFTVSRAISHEIVRHRKASFAQCSQRYVCYSKEKFGGEISFIIPEKIYQIAETLGIEKIGSEMVEDLLDKNSGVLRWYNNLKSSEEDYIYLTTIDLWKAQEARDVLPNACSTIINVCMFDSDWVHFFDLRSLGKTGAPDPNMRKIATQVMNKMIETGIFDLNDNELIL